MESNSIQIELLNIKMDLLNTKLDLLINEVKVKNDFVKKEFVKNDFVKKEEFNWSIQDYKDCVLVQFPFNRVFIEFIKEIGGKFNNTKKAWIFPKSNETFIEEIKDKFPNWVFNNLNLLNSNNNLNVGSTSDFIDEV